MDLINNNQKQNLPYLGTTLSSIKNSQVSGFYDHNLNTFILKYKENNLNNKNITSVSSSNAATLQSNQKVDGSIGPVASSFSKQKQINKGSQTSFEQLIEYKNNLNLQFNKINNKNQIILNLKKVTIGPTTDTEFELHNLGHTNKKSNLVSKGTEYLGHQNILSPVKFNYNTISFNPSENGLGPTNIGAFAAEEISSAAFTLSEGCGPTARKNKFKINMDTLVSKYLKPISKFNLGIATSQYLEYKFNNNKQKIISNITSILKNSFYTMYCIISRPVLHITPNKIIINLFFFVSRNKTRRQIGSSYSSLKFLSNNHKELQYLCTNLSKCLKKPVELELVRLYYPYNDSQILANSIGLLSKNIKNRFRTLVDNTFNFSKIKNPTKMGAFPSAGLSVEKEKATGGMTKTRISILPSFLTGIKFRLGGRLLSQKVIPRFTVQTFQDGSLARTKANIVTSSRFTHKNKRGTFSITVSVGQGFF